MSKNKVVLEVSLDTTLNPPVVISDRKLNAVGRKIQWKRKKGETFEFDRLNELDQAYFYRQSIDVDRKKITCNNRAPAGPEYPYVIVVTQGGVKYDSTKTGPNPDGKPVIRN